MAALSAFQHLERNTGGHTSPSGRASSSSVTFSVGLARLLRNRTFLLFLTGCFLVNQTLTAFNSFCDFISDGWRFGCLDWNSSSHRIDYQCTLHAGSGLYVLRRWGHERTMLLAAGAYMLRWGIQWLWPSPEVMIGVQVLHGLSFGFFYIAAVEYVASVTGREMQATGQSLFNMVFAGLGGIVGNMLNGYLLDTGPSMMYLACTISAAMGQSFCISSADRPKSREGLTRLSRNRLETEGIEAYESKSEAELAHQADLFVFPLFLLTISILIFLSFLIVNELSRKETRKADMISTRYIVSTLERTMGDIEMRLLDEIETNKMYSRFLEAQTGQLSSQFIYDVASGLNRMVDQQGMVQSIYLYRISDSSIITPRGMVSLEDFEDKAYIDQSLKNKLNLGWNQPRSYKERSFDVSEQVISMNKWLPLPWGGEGLLVISVRMYALERQIDNMTDANLFLQVKDDHNELVYSAHQIASAEGMC